LHDIKAQASHFKNKVGKIENLFNPNHRHDEAHEQETDRKRTAIAESHRFGSFAPEHDGNRVKWYVDAQDYLWAVSEALDRAQETIYLADWWISPELFMRRPPYYNQEWRLDQILKRRAEAGVQIYVIVYKEVRRPLYIRVTSLMSLARLNKQSPAILHIQNMLYEPCAPKAHQGLEISISCGIPTTTCLRIWVI
jgi:phospholipase D1/2